MKKDYKVGDQVEVISRKYSHEFEIGYIGVITDTTYSTNGVVLKIKWYYIDNTWWVTAEEIKPIKENK